MKIFLIAGLLGGLAHRWPEHPWLAWLAIALLYIGLRGCGGWRRAAGVWLACTLKEAVAFSWLAGSASYFLELSAVESAVLACLSYVLCGTLRCLPLYLAWCVGERTCMLRYSWIVALGMAGGDYLVGEIVGFSLGDLLYSQWRSETVRAAVATYGWWQSSALITILCIELVEVIRGRRVVATVAACAAGAILLTAPEPGHDMKALAGVRPMQISPQGSGGDCPRGAKLLVWPEGYLSQVISADEGETDYQIHTICRNGDVETYHIAGMVTRGGDGLQNSAVVVDATSTVRQVRAKRLLVPLAESTEWPWSAAVGPRGFVPGRAVPVLSSDMMKVGVLICFEVLSRRLAAEAASAGAQLLLVISSDLSLGGDQVAQEQWIGALSLRSAEFGLPAARSSLGGMAVLIDSGGHVRQMGLTESSDS